MGETPLRVAMVLQAYPPVLGGAQRQVQRLGPQLARRGVRATVVTRRPAGTPARATEPGLEVLRVSDGGAGPRASLAFTGRGALALLRLRPDVVHVHDLMSPATVALAGAVPRGVPVVAKVASTGPGGDVDRLLHKPLGRGRLALAARRFAAFVCLTRQVEEELRAHGVPAARLRRVPNGVDARRFRPVSAEQRRRERALLGIPPDGPLVLYCGRFSEVKRLPVLVEAFARGAPGARLALAGEGPEEPALLRLAGELGVAERVHLLAPTEQPELLYRAADAYASASGTEGMSGSMLEAMASGVPVAASPASGVGELLAEGCGLRAADPSPEALAGALGRLAGDGEARARIGAAARARVEERYALATVADRLAALYRELASRS